jgi:hypothetical protein
MGSLGILQFDDAVEQGRAVFIRYGRITASAPARVPLGADVFGEVIPTHSRPHITGFPSSRPDL